jgi:uncharacterized protein (DUF362 family)/ferredoxin
MQDVSVAPCIDYSPDIVRQGLENVLEPLGGLDWVMPGMRIAIKTNLVTFLKPEAAATTHPALLCELIRMLKERGASVMIGDSPGGPYTALNVNRVYSAAGMHLCEEAGAELNHDFGQCTAKFERAVIAKEFQYTSYLDNADAIINFCKLKTHGMMAMSASVKNMFGVIPGTLKAEYHFRFPNLQAFADMLIDLNLYFKPRLSIVDAVVGMEGNGPTRGTPRPMGLLLASLSPYKLDLACATVMGLSKEDVPTLAAAFSRGLIPADAAALDVGKTVLSRLTLKDFQNIKHYNGLLFMDETDGVVGKVFGEIVKKALCSVPDYEKEQCIGCEECKKFCPAKAITMKNGYPKINRKECIHCFCCQEFCLKGAMRVKRPFVAKILDR